MPATDLLSRNLIPLFVSTHKASRHPITSVPTLSRTGSLAYARRPEDSGLERSGAVDEFGDPSPTCAKALRGRCSRPRDRSERAGRGSKRAGLDRVRVDPDRRAAQTAVRTRSIHHGPNDQPEFLSRFCILRREIECADRGFRIPYRELERAACSPIIKDIDSGHLGYLVLLDDI